MPQFEKFQHPHPYTDIEIKQKYANADTVMEMPAIFSSSHPHDGYVSSPCPSWHPPQPPVKRRPDEIETEIKRWFTKCVVALFVIWGLYIALIIVWKISIAVWMMK
jgi:hypothetical protein